jgi:hypothetical protein
MIGILITSGRGRGFVDGRIPSSMRQRMPSLSGGDAPESLTDT